MAVRHNYFTSNSSPPYANTLVEIWNGKTWSITPSPNEPSLAGSDSNELFSVSCPSVSDCMAVDSTGNSAYGAGLTLVETWNGTSWSIAPSPNQPGAINNEVQGVSCTKATHCVAVGDYENYNVVPPQISTLIETWNGVAWSLTPSPNSSSYDNLLSGGVSCKSTHCVAVGHSFEPGQTLASIIRPTSG